MTNDLAKTPDALPALGNDLAAAARHYEQSWSAATIRAYRSDWKDWEAYCRSRGVLPLPADPLSLAGYLSALAEGTWLGKRKLSTIERRRAAVRHMHVEAGQADPSADPRVVRVLAGIRRQLTVAKTRKAPVRAKDLLRMMTWIALDFRGDRDAALILLGFATGCRRSELIALQVSDVRSHPEGLVVEVRRSKTDQTGEGSIKLVRMGRNRDTCPVRALERWLRRGRVTEGPLFREITSADVVTNRPMSARAVARAVQRAARSAGLNPAHFSGHSLRAGYVTEADARGAKTTDIMAQTGHKSAQMIAIYTRYNVDERFATSSALDLGL